MLPSGTYAVLVDSSGSVLLDPEGVEIALQLPGTTGQPELPTLITDPGPEGKLYTAGSAVGGGDWRISINRALAGPNRGYYIIIALPTEEVTESLRKLILIEASAAGGLLVILAGGSWLILRRGLRPLEQMADSTRSITAGGLSHRVEPSDGGARSASSAWP